MLETGIMLNARKFLDDPDMATMTSEERGEFVIRMIEACNSHDVEYLRSLPFVDEVVQRKTKRRPW